MLNRKPVFLSALIASLFSAPAIAENPYTQADQSWISISGTVASPEPSSFMLDYGDGVVMVEMDDWDRYGDAYGMKDGDKVTVYGRVDADLWEATSIEASSVYVEDLNTYFYANSADEEDAQVWAISTPVVVSRTNVRGVVSEVSPREEQFTIDTGDRKVTVETELMNYNPLDDIGFQQIDVGDRVSATGAIDYEFFDGRVLEADTLITLSDERHTDS